MAMAKFSDIKYMDYDSWFEFWYMDKKEILSCMHRNMAADIDAGYNPMGKSIRSQIDTIREYENSINAQLDKFVSMDEKQVEKWCYYDCLKRGAID